LIDLHLHTTASDGALAPPDLVLEARAAGLSILSVTDHDTTGGLAAAQDAAAGAHIEVIPGIEISSVADGRDVHVLGYFVDPESPSLRAFLLSQRQDRLRRISDIRDRLSVLGCPIDIDPILDAAARGQSVGRPQIAAALVRAGHVRSRDEAFDRFLEFGGPAFVPRAGVSPAEVVSLVHEAGGIASLAHPGLTACDALIPPLAAAGLDAIEAWHPDHDASTQAKYRRLAAALGLLVTGGSDFHGVPGHGASTLGSVALPAADLERLRIAADRRRAADP